jgi:hypothetical protein
MKIGDEVYVHGYVDEIRKDVVIIRNEGGYFGTDASEVILADRKTENSSEIPNNCEPKTGKMMTEEEFDSMLARVLIGKDEPQPNADQHVQRIEYVGNDEKSRCWTCKHFERMHETPISSDGSYYTYVVCTAKECKYEPKDEPQTGRSE